MGVRRLIHCVESNKPDEEFDHYTIQDCREMIGYYEPEDADKDTWTITMMDEGSSYTATGQENAQIIASLEEIKALLMKK